MRCTLALLLLTVIMPTLCEGETKMVIPNDFPHFVVPGFNKEMDSVRALYWLHYGGSGPKATLWDEWLPSPSLWPAVDTDGKSSDFRLKWDEVLSNRVMDAEGYVATHQHASIAHPQGWPFPFWNQGSGGWGWHFSFKNTVGPPWRPDTLSTQEGWKLSGARDQGIDEDGWKLTLTEPDSIIQAPAKTIDTFQSPFIQLRWSAKGLGNAQPFIEWATRSNPHFSPERRFYFDPFEGATFSHTAIPIYKHPLWKGKITGLRIGCGNASAGAEIIVQAFFTQYDTRHNINGQNFIRGCIKYFRWTRDLNFLRRNINRMRLAVRYLMTEHQTLKKKAVFTDWVGHDGVTGVERTLDGKKTIHSGRGIGNNYWDLMPFGYMDVYATVQYYSALREIMAIERDITNHPEWDIPGGALRLDPGMLEAHAEEVKSAGNRMFWNSKTGRFAPIDANGKMHDYGYTFLNCEAIYYGFATPAHAREIMKWIDGERIVRDDTSQGADIYHWKFGPRATTKRNLEWYFWAWNGPESIPWGGQVQDGGGVLGFAYHDLMARIKTLGPDSAWKRLRETINWFDEVQAVGGYRKYYDGKREGTMQGGGTAGGLGLDQEFFESVLVPQVLIDGFLGFAPTGDGFRIEPHLPTAWPSLTIDRIHFQSLVLTITASRGVLEIRKQGRMIEPCYIRLPKGDWLGKLIDADGKSLKPVPLTGRRSDGAYKVNWADSSGVRFEPAQRKQ